MHFYPFNIGDYLSHTRHLSLLEDLAYRRLLDIYYLHEQPLNESPTVVARLINMRDNVDEVTTVLEEFFDLEPGEGWTSARAKEEIEKYQSKLEAASRAGKASAAARSNARSTDGSTDVQPNKKQETLNKKQETKINIPKPDGVSDQVWKDFKNQRTKMKAPLTTTALTQLIKQAELAGWTLEQAMQECILRGWRGFKAEWVNVTKPGKQSIKDTTDWGSMEDL